MTTVEYDPPPLGEYDPVFTMECPEHGLWTTLGKRPTNITSVPHVHMLVKLDPLKTIETGGMVLALQIGPRFLSRQNAEVFKKQCDRLAELARAEFQEHRRARAFALVLRETVLDLSHCSVLKTTIEGGLKPKFWASRASHVIVFTVAKHLGIEIPEDHINNINEAVHHSVDCLLNPT